MVNSAIIKDIVTIRSRFFLEDSIMNNKVRIGLLSTYFGISKQTLIHYDRIGLLKPSIVEDNKYRYYTFEDVDRLELILRLKDTGLSLKEIAAYLESPSLEESIQLLKNQNDQLEANIERLQRTKLKIDYKIQELEYIQTIDLQDTIQLKNKVERYIIQEEINNDPYDEHAVIYTFGRITDYIWQHPKYQRYGHSVEGVVIDTNYFKKQVFDRIKSTFIFIDDYEGLEKESVLPAGLYLTLFHKGTYNSTSRSYKRMLDYITANDLEIIGDAIEIPLITAWSVKKESDYVVDIQIPIRRKTT